MIFDSIRRPQPHASSDGCSRCHQSDVATVDLYCGRRCARCAPTFDGRVAVRLMRAEGVRAALVYIRTYASMEAAA